MRLDTRRGGQCYARRACGVHPLPMRGVRLLELLLGLRGQAALTHESSYIPENSYYSSWGVTMCTQMYIQVCEHLCLLLLE